MYRPVIPRKIAPMTRNRPLCQATLLLLLLAGSAAAWAQSPGDNPPKDRSQAKAQREDLPDAVRRVERETGGEVLRAEPMQRDGREVYRLKVLTADGRVRVLQDDPNAPRDDRQRNDTEQDNGRGNSDRRNSDRAGSDQGNSNGNGSGKEKRPSRDPDGEPKQF